MESGTNGAGQVRSVHIIYFLSRGGKNEDPHLIRVRHRNGVYLRDVKRWLSKLRGKDMPETYAWSYKRRYKHGFVWQDLLDDDLITPISDSEYVLKGSHITHTISFDSCIISKENPPLTKEGEPQVHSSETQINITPTKTSSEITDYSTLSSTVTQESLGQENKMSNTHQNGSKKVKDQSSICAILVNKKNKMESMLFNRNTEKNNGNQDSSTSTSSSSSSASTTQPNFSRSKSYTSGASQAILNWLPCRSTDTNDAVLSSARCSADNKKSSGKAIARSEIAKGEKLGESASIFSTCWEYHQHLRPEHNGRKSCDGFKNGTREFAAYRSLSEPNCKQCGKPVKPESWIKHVQSCKETTALLKKAAVTFKDEPSRKSSSHF